MNNNDLVAGLDRATLQNDGHDPGLPDQGSIGCARKHCGQKARLEGLAASNLKCNTHQRKVGT